MQRIETDPAVHRSAPKDLQRAVETLQRSERFKEYWGGAEDARHYAYLSRRYSEIAGLQGKLLQQQERVARLEMERDRLRRMLQDARLMIVGDGPWRPQLERYAAGLGMGDAIEFTGYLGGEELVELLNRVHLLFNPSPKEGWGLTVVEANACGVPVVASDRPGLRDSVVDGRSGFLVPYGDAVAFGEKAALLLSDRELWKTMSEAAIERTGELTWERCARETERSLLSAAGIDLERGGSG